MTMVVQHVDSRLALSSVNPSDQLHEFQIVHALITQCRKQASVDGNVRSLTASGRGSAAHSPDSNSLQRKGSKEDRTSIVMTIRQTFNALAQATNPSLCAKQNASPHPVSIASTVKNIISQFSRQTHYGSLALASPSQSPVTKPTSPSRRRDLSTRKKIQTSKEAKSDRSSQQLNSSPHSSLSEPSTSSGPTLECTPIKTAVIRQSNSNPIATKPKTRSVRARNAHRLVRHESAPIPPPAETKGAIKKSSASVRRSKSDAICYTSYARQTRCSNVQTKVLHFENCCKGKGQASMCLECRKHSFEEGLPFTAARSSSAALPKAEAIKPDEEDYVGALSYHKPSIMTLSQNAPTERDAGVVTSSVSQPELAPKKTPPPTTAKPKAVLCPGGTYFFSEKVDSLSSSQSVRSTPCTSQAENPAIGSENATVAPDSPNINPDLPQCSQMKRKHSDSEDDPMQRKKESKDDEMENTAIVQLESPSNAITSISPQQEASLPNQVTGEETGDNDVACGSTGMYQDPVASENQNLYSLLTNWQSSPQSAISSPDNLKHENEADKQLDYDSSDNLDSLSTSSGDTCISPRQEYLSRCARRSASLRQAPCSRYQKMRRKLKKLITRSRSCSEVLPPVVVQTSSEIEKGFLESIRIPTPVFMLSKDSFSAKRLQLAMHFDSQKADLMSRLPDPVLVQIFSYMDTRSLAMLKCVCQDFNFIINSYDIRGTDSLWVKDKRYLDDPCKFCRKQFTAGDVSMCRYHAKSYHCDLPYGRSYWMCCFQLERNAPGCRTGIHNNYWGPSS